MADISNIKVGNTTYSIKDSTARSGKVDKTTTINNIPLSSDIETRLIFNNKSVTWSEVQSTDADYNEDYPWRGTIQCNGVESEMIPEVILSISDATSGDFAPISISDENVIKIYASEEKVGTVVPTAIAWR